MLLALLSLVVASAKFVATTLTFQEGDQWQYFSKFAVDVGTGNFKLRARFITPVEPQSDEEHPFLLPIYLDSQWDEALSQQTCEGRLRSSRIEKLVTVPKNGEWSEEVSGVLMQRVRPYFWFFVLADCRPNAQEVMQVKVEVVFFNADESHYSLDEKNLEYLYFGALLVFLGTLSANGVVLFHRFRKVDSMERPLLLLNSAVAVQTIAIVAALFHYWCYATNGKGLPLLAFLGQALDLLSQLLITLLLILVGSGWTITYRDLPRVVAPSSLVLVLLEFCAAGVNRMSGEAYDKFSEFDGTAGVFISLVRLGLFTGFVRSVRSLHHNTQGVAQTVILQFSLIASLYFLAVPCLSVASRVFATYLRNKIVLVSNFTVQLLAFVGLSRLFREKSLYHKVSTFADSVLPASKLR